MERAVALLAGLLLSSFAVTATSGQSSTWASIEYPTRVLPGQSPSVGLPLSTAQLVPAIELLAWYARVPIGFEGLDDDPFGLAPSSGELQFGGDTLAEALEKIVVRQPHYRWSQENCVIHLRPRTARVDPNNLLNRPVEALELHGVTLSEALHEVHLYLRPELRGRGIVGSGPGPRELGLRRFSVTVSRTTVLGLLDAIVVAHSAASWHVTYTNDPQWPYQIGFGTFDGWGQTS
jgi:hypothetical protein